VGKNFIGAFCRKGKCDKCMDQACVHKCHDLGELEEATKHGNWTT